MEQILLDSLTNAAWQIPLLAGGAWLFIRIGNFGPRTQHCMWLTVLALAVGLPIRGVRPAIRAATQAACADCSFGAPTIAGREALPPAAILTQLVVADPRLPGELFTLPHPTLRLSAEATDWVISVYFAILLFGIFRIVLSWRRARQLIQDAEPVVLSSQCYATFHETGRRLGVRLPELRCSAEVHSPVIVGMMHPVLLLPEDFMSHGQSGMQAAFLHELAHVRRHDYLGNLLCRVAALPVAWHPVIYGVQQRIRRTREMVCDDIAARAMQSEIGYAKCLLAMAVRTIGQHDCAQGAQAIGLFGGNVLEERIMRLMQEKKTMTMQAKLIRVASGAIAMILAVAMAASFHVRPTLAQTSGTAVTVPPPAAPPTPSAPDLAVVPPVPAQSHLSAAPAPPVPPEPFASDTAVVPPTPPAPDQAVTPVPPIAPAAPTKPEVNPSPRKKKVVGHHPKQGSDKSFVVDKNGRSFVVDLNGSHALTPEQQRQLDKQMAAVDVQIAEATKRFNSPEFKQQMAEIAKRQADMKRLDFAQMQRQIDAATAKINSPEFKKQMADIQKQIESGAMQRSMGEASKQMKLAEQQQAALQKLDMAKVQRQIDAATAKINSPEFRKQMENLQKQIESGALQRSMEEANRRFKAAEDQMRQAQMRQEQTK
ncbi:MAG: M56 family metallopeptidase [Acidobacteriota bacterium]